jgi:putative alpha-1,2-mannosidase
LFAPSASDAMRFFRTTFFLFISILWLLPLSAGAQENPVDFVDPRIGASGDDSNCNIGPQLPFGSINPAPETPNSNQNGYHPAQPIRGFGQLHVSGIGWTKYGEVFVSPQVGLAVGELEHDSPKADEIVRPYLYGVTLTRYSVRAEVAPAMHSAIYRFGFPKTNDAAVIIDATHNIPMDIVPYVGGKVSYAFVMIDSVRHRISGGGRYEGGFGAAAYNVYFCAEFNLPSADCGTWLNGKISSSNHAEFLRQANDRVGGYVKFHTAEDVPVLMKIAVSLKSIDQAAYWLEHEVPGWDFDKVSQRAKSAWSSALGKIRCGCGMTSTPFGIRGGRCSR